MTTWNNQQKFAGQTPITYNEVGATYNNIGYSYWGYLQTMFSNAVKSVASFTNISRTTNTSFTNQNKN